MLLVSFLRYKHRFISRSISYCTRTMTNSSLVFEKQINFNRCNHVSLKTAISLITVNQRCMAGHSKWQNIKHVKAEKDREKHFLSNKYVRLIRIAVKENGPDPKSNNKLKHLLDEARKYNISKDTLENALKKSSNKKSIYGMMEILAPGGCMVILEYETGNVSETRHEIKTVCKRYNANVLSGEGRWRAVYEKKGVITAVNEKDSKELDEAKALDNAIEAGAEEVQMKEDEEGKNFLEFVCAPDDLLKVKKELEKQYELQEYYVAYIPTTSVQLSNEDMTLVDNFLEEMGALPDVVRIFENVQ